MSEQDLISLGMYVNELEHLQRKHGIWLQNADVFSLAQADPIAKIGAGGGQYFVELLNDPVKSE